MAPGRRLLHLAAPHRTVSLLLLLALGASGCGTRVLNPFAIPAQAISAPPQALRYSLAELPYREYWAGVVMLGDKVGFSHLRLEPTGDGGYLIESEAAMNFRLLGYGKSVHLRARDWVDRELRLRRFQYEYRTDDSIQSQEGEISGGQLHVRIQNSAGETALEQELHGVPVYPSAALNLYPLLQGLYPDASYDYQVYDGQRLTIARVRQHVKSYESSDLFEGDAYKMHTSLGGDTVRTWIDEQGRPALEISSHNLLIAGLESERRARRYLTQGALSKSEKLIDFSLVRSDRRLRQPRSLRYLELALSGLGELQLPASTTRQQCTPGPEPGQAVCRVRVEPHDTQVDTQAAPDPERYLARTLRIPTNHPTLRKLAEEISQRQSWPVPELVQWLQDNIEQKIIDSHTALDVLERGAGECQGHSYLYAALARSLGLPTRVMNGLVYSEQHHGFLYHTWVESWNGASWQAIDPTFGQEHADATHIALLEGDDPDELAPLMTLLGRLQARVLSTEPPPRDSLP